MTSHAIPFPFLLVATLSALISFGMDGIKLYSGISFQQRGLFYSRIYFALLSLTQLAISVTMMVLHLLGLQYFPFNVCFILSKTVFIYAQVSVEVSNLEHANNDLQRARSISNHSEWLFIIKLVLLIGSLLPFTG